MTASIDMLASRAELIQSRHRPHGYPVLAKHPCGTFVFALRGMIVSRNAAPLDIA
ncbi:hypothetical protein [Caballeronia sp. dw_19]|uniref:hypothetical protein n=1 Tax=Caballeronia sp. dw_19 TaxID=2719791 RepID=UPI001BD299FC|nr:hypothetical protein [Caballeronia sp. dw_19]